MATSQRSDARELRDFLRGAAGGLDDALGFQINSVGHWMAHRNANDAATSPPRPVGDRLAPIVIDAHDHGPARLNADDQPFFDGSVVAHGAVAIKMVLGEIDQDADRWINAGCEVDLERRALDHMHTAGLGWRERQDRRANIAAELGVEAGLGAYVGD